LHFGAFSKNCSLNISGSKYQGCSANIFPFTSIILIVPLNMLAKEHAIKSGIFSAGSKAIRCAAVNAVEWRALSKLTNKADDRFRARP